MRYYLSIDINGNIDAVNTGFAVTEGCQLHAIDTDLSFEEVKHGTFYRTAEPVTQYDWFAREVIPIVATGYVERSDS